MSLSADFDGQDPTGADFIPAFGILFGPGVLLRRYVNGPGDDEPLVWYEGSGTTDRRFLHPDERGSIVAVTDSSGALIGINKYDEYGQVQGSLTGRFGYTGQFAQPFTSLYYYKNRTYDPQLGRFMQTDPIGYADSPNLYAYVLNDPVNLVDPTGMDIGCQTRIEFLCERVSSDGSGGSSGGGGSPPGGGGGGGGFWWCAGCGREAYSIDPNDPDQGFIIPSQQWTWIQIVIRGNFGWGNWASTGGGPSRGTFVTSVRQVEDSGQCAPAAGRGVRAFEGMMSTVSSYADKGATLALLFGQPEISAGFAVASGVATFAKAGSQRLRGDKAGSNATLVAFAVSFSVNRISNFMPIGGAAQANFNKGIASELGDLTGTGVGNLVNCQ